MKYCNAVSWCYIFKPHWNAGIALRPSSCGCSSVHREYDKHKVFLKDIFSFNLVLTNIFTLRVIWSHSWKLLFKFPKNIFLLLFHRCLSWLHESQRVIFSWWSVGNLNRAAFVPVPLLAPSHQWQLRSAAPAWGEQMRRPQNIINPRIWNISNWYWIFEGCITHERWIQMTIRSVQPTKKMLEVLKIYRKLTAQSGQK